tara:strand:- start:161 stop:724 length:564 start_codon:yes stop_codon:yes gene_type:complete
MSKFDQESLSALLDDEADELAVPRLLKLYEENPEITEKWRRFSLVQSIVREEIIPVKQGFMKGVREGIDREDKISRLIRPVVGDSLIKMVIAASIATICVMSGKMMLEGTSDFIEIADQVPQTYEVPEVFPSSDAEGEITEADLKAQELLKEYISRIQIDEEEPPLIEHLQDSPLYRLVNELQPRDN